jgi:hypothetical protein
MSATIRWLDRGSGCLLVLGLFDFGGGVTFNNSQAEVATTARRVDHCARDRVTNSSQNSKAAVSDLSMGSVDIKDVPLPPTPAGLKGTRTIPFQFMGYSGPATVEWTIAPIAAR